MNDTIRLKWTLGVTDDPGRKPIEWILAQIPGAVQADLARHLGLPPLHHTDTVRRLDAYEDTWAIYRARIPDGLSREALYLEGGGIDYTYRISLNGTLLFSYEGMFRPFSVALSRGWKEKGNELTVVILPPPKIPGKTGRDQAAKSCKPPVSYGWDFHPRLVVRGI